MTLLRDVPREMARDAARRIEPPISWHVGAPVLLESRSGSSGVRYLPVTVPAGNA